MNSVEWKGIESNPRIAGKPVLLFEPGYGVQVGQWDPRLQQFTSPSRSFGNPFKLGLIQDVEDLYRKVPIAATKWADLDLDEPPEDIVDVAPEPPTRRRPELRLIVGGTSAA